MHQQTCKYPANQTLHKYAACTSWCKHTLLLLMVVRIYVRRRRVCKKHTADNNNIHVAGSAAAIWMATSLSSLHMQTRPFILISAGMCVCMLVMIIMERRADSLFGMLAALVWTKLDSMYVHTRRGLPAPAAIWKLSRSAVVSCALLTHV